jgi:hypothetical protein
MNELPKRTLPQAGGPRLYHPRGAAPCPDRSRRLSLPKLVDGLRYATPDEKRELFEVINAKLKNLKRLPPEQQQHVVNQLNAAM